MEGTYRDLVLVDVVPKLVTLSVDEARFDAASGQDSGETHGVMAATVAVVVRFAAEFFAIFFRFMGVSIYYWRMKE